MARVLIVEDQKEIQIILREPLEMQGHEVVLVENGNDALKELEERNFDLMITDIVMPNMTGLALMKEIKKNNENMKIIAISGGGRISTEDYLDTAKKIGAVATFKKPLDITNYMEVVENVLSA